ncbi:MAG: hypothetical protein IT317_04965 [Anaerolineales bacterium]|nr:hypothetical protein [Anaerolineales bacterium]
MKLAQQRLAALALLLFAVPAPRLAQAGSASASATLRVLPAGGTYPVGAVFEVVVVMEAAASLYGADLKLSFDQTRLAVLDADANTAGVQVTPRGDLLSPDLVLQRSADNAQGEVRYVVTQLMPSEPVTGTGALLAFQVQALAAGPATLAIDSFLLSDRDGNSLPALTAGATYTLTTGYTLWAPIAVR